MKISAPVYFLLVDDLEDNLLALEALLRRDGLVVLKARSGSEALELLLVHDVALALVDVQMPEMDGFELAELIRGTEKTRWVPIIFLTAGGPDEQRRFRGYEAGAVDFIRKPVENDVLRSKAEVFYELYRQRQEVACQRDELSAATTEISRLLAESRRHTETLREMDQRKDEFLATLAHELRNPLAPILNAVAVMQFKGLGDPLLESMREVIERQATHMARLVDELLDVSRIATGKLSLQLKTMDLTTVVNGAIEVARSIIDLHGHQLDVVMPSHPILLKGDEVRLTQVFANLLTNAAKYTEPGGNIRIVSEADGDLLRVHVDDTGIGIPKEMLSRVFGLFAQIDCSLERTKGGLGVGLALVRRLVELHKGQVTANSAGLGQGSRFTVTLPRLTANNSHGPNDVLLPPRTDEYSSEALRILIVDDNEDAAKSLKMLLDFRGHLTRVSHTGLGGLAVARDFQPVVCILDIGLPGMSGYEVARALRCDAAFADTTLIALSGYATEEDKRLAIEAGFNMHLTKPANISMIDQILAARQYLSRPAVHCEI